MPSMRSTAGRLAALHRRHSYAAGLMIVLLAAPAVLSPMTANWRLAGQERSPLSPASEEERNEEIRHEELSGSHVIRRRVLDEHDVLPVASFQRAAHQHRAVQSSSLVATERADLNGCGALLRC